MQLKLLPFVLDFCLFWPKFGCHACTVCPSMFSFGISGKREPRGPGGTWKIVVKAAALVDVLTCSIAPLVTWCKRHNRMMCAFTNDAQSHIYTFIHHEGSTKQRKRNTQSSEKTETDERTDKTQAKLSKLHT